VRFVPSHAPKNFSRPRMCSARNASSPTPNSRSDGVFALWYGKGPVSTVRRCAQARHAVARRRTAACSSGGDAHG